MNQQSEFVVEGIQFLLKNYPDYDKDNLIDKKSGGHYCIDYILDVFHDTKWKRFVLKMLLFDFLIGNADRHQNNWAVLLGYEDQKSELYTRLCPLYDNGSSLCCYVSNDNVDTYLGKDKNRFFSLIDTKSKSIIRIHPLDTKRPTHKEVLKYLLDSFPEAYGYAIDMQQRFMNSNVLDAIDCYPDEVLSNRKKN